jgi:uncharacterized protein (DUF58 family)
VRESEQGITDRVNIFLDTDREWHSPGRPSETFETSVRAVAALGIKHLKDGFAVSVEGNGERLAKNMRGVGRQIPFLDKLAAVDMEADTLTSSLDRLFVDPARNSHNVIVTPYLSPQSASRIRLLRDRGTAVMIVLILWDDTDPSTIHRAGGIGCNVVEIHAGQSLARVFDHVVGARR